MRSSTSPHRTPSPGWVSIGRGSYRHPKFGEVWLESDGSWSYRSPGKRPSGHVRTMRAAMTFCEAEATANR